MAKKRPNSKAKGGAWEREICSLLSLWWSDNQDDSIFWRTASSGGRATVRSKKQKTTKGHHGDICATCPEGQPLLDLVTIEVKKGYSSRSIMDLLDKPHKAATQKYEEWFLQADRERKESGSKSWLIISKRDRREALVFFPETLACLLARGGSEILRKTITPWLSLEFYLDDTRWDVTVFHLSEFLRLVSPYHMRKALET